MYMTSDEREEAQFFADKTPGESFVCKSCGKDAVIVQRDFGIGAYEYWGSKGVHRDMRNCCSECGDEV
jgi:hypothetical protein